MTSLLSKSVSSTQVFASVSICDHFCTNLVPVITRETFKSLKKVENRHSGTEGILGRTENNGNKFRQLLSAILGVQGEILLFFFFFACREDLHIINSACDVFINVLIFREVVSLQHLAQRQCLGSYYHVSSYFSLLFHCGKIYNL